MLDDATHQTITAPAPTGTEPVTGHGLVTATPSDALPAAKLAAPSVIVPTPVPVAKTIEDALKLAPKVVALEDALTEQQLSRAGLVKGEVYLPTEAFAKASRDAIRKREQRARDAAKGRPKEMTLRVPEEARQCLTELSKACDAGLIKPEEVTAALNGLLNGNPAAEATKLAADLEEAKATVAKLEAEAKAKANSEAATKAEAKAADAEVSRLRTQVAEKAKAEANAKDEVASLKAKLEAAAKAEAEAKAMHGGEIASEVLADAAVLAPRLTVVLARGGKRAAAVRWGLAEGGPDDAVPTELAGTPC